MLRLPSGARRGQWNKCRVQLRRLVVAFKPLCGLLLQEAAQMVGKKIAELCLSNNISKVSFDRGGNVYQGRIKVC
jgi:Ribosomal L18 of archaea, bacteria, mitoch. and chloroplast